MTKLLQIPQKTGLNSENISVASLVPANQNTRSASEPVQFDIDMFSVDRNGTVTSGNATTICNNSNHAFFKITLTTNVKRKIINKAILKVGQSSYSADNFYVCLSDADHSISEENYADGYMRLITENGVRYRLIDISPFIQRASSQVLYIAVVSKASDFVTFYTGQGTDPQPTLELELLEDDDFIPASSVSNSVGPKGSYNVNARNGKLFFTQTLYNSKGGAMPLSLSVAYNAEDYNTTNPLASVNKFKGWNFNYAQSLAQDGEDMLYLDGNHMYHKFKKATNSATAWTDASAKNGAFIVAQSSGYKLSDGQVTTMEFDSNKRLTKIQKQVGTSGSTKLYETTTITYNTDGTISTITDGMGDVYTFTYATNSVAIRKGTTILATLEFSSQKLTKISYAFDSRTVQFTYAASGLLISVTDSLACQKVVFNYNTSHAISAIKQYATHTSGNQATNAYFMQYDLLQTRVHSCRNSDLEDNKYSTIVYNFAEDGEEISSSLEIGEELKPLRIRSKGDFESLFGKVQDIPLADVTFGGSKSVTVSTSGTSDLFELDTSNSALNTYILSAQALVERSCFDLDRELKVKLMDGNTEVCNMVINASARKLQAESCAFTLSQGVHTLKVRVETGGLLLSVRFSNIRITATNLGVTKQFINQFTTAGSIQEPNGTTWYTPTRCTLDYGVDEATNVRFTVKDYQLTTISRLQNSTNFNVWYNDGANMVYGVSSANLVLTSSPCGLGTVRMCTFTPSHGKQNFSFLEPSTSYLFKMRNATYAIAGGSVTSTEEVNNKFQTVKATDEKGIVTEYTYNSQGSVTKVKTKAPSGTLLNIEEDTAYNTTYNLPSSEKETRYYTEYSHGYTYGSDYELTKETLPNSQVLNYTYETDKDKLKSISATVSNVAHSNTIAYEGDLVDTLTDSSTLVDFAYDERQNISQVNIAGTSVLSKVITYNPSGTTQSVTTYGNGQKIKKYYDKYDRLIKASSVSGTSETVLVKYIYSDKEVASTVTEPTDSSLAISANSKLRVLIDSVANTRTVYTYDAFGKLTQTQNSSFATLQTFDEYERVTSHYCLVDNGIASMNSFTFASNVDDTVTQESVRIASSSVQPIATSYTKDGLQRPTETKVMQGNYGYKTTLAYIPRQTREWIEEDDGPIIIPPILPTAVSPTATGGYWETTTVGTTPYISTFKEYSMSGSTATLVRTDAVEYDANGNITKYGDVTYVYDKLNRLIRENNPALDKTIIWSYNALGNRTEAREYAYTTATSPTGGTTTVFMHQNGWGNQVTIISQGTTTKTISYDNAGNPTNYKGATLTWTRGRLLASYNAISMQYNADGIRKSKIRSQNNTTISTEYYYDGNNLVREKIVQANVSQSTTTNKTFLYNSQGIIGFAIGSTVYTYRKNLFGDIIAIYQGATKKAAYVYDAWGNCTITQDTDGIGAANPFRYRGYYWDNDLQLYYLMSRYYDPATGRFINADSLEYLDPETIGGLNLYAYCGNNPVMGVDPEGHMPQWAKWLVGGLVIAGLAIATVATGGAAGGVAGFILAGALKGAVVGAVSSALTNGIVEGIESAKAEEGFWSGFLDGAADGFMTGSIIGGVTGAINAGAQVYSASKLWAPSRSKSAYRQMVDHYSDHVIKEGQKAVAKNIVNYSKQASQFFMENSSLGVSLRNGVIKIPGAPGGIFNTDGLIRSFWYILK
ncbi:MAG: RHS repeat-associated core domain-containing protein [Clostridia bacterium]|nr:RHS repeat-associated core domain-containing protein [Clostridia bacterium]